MALSNTLHTKEITTSQVSGVKFGFFKEDEVCHMSGFVDIHILKE